MANKLPAFFPCGCSRNKVRTGLCEYFAPDGTLVKPVPPPSVEPVALTWLQAKARRLLRRITWMMETREWPRLCADPQCITVMVGDRRRRCPRHSQPRFKRK